MTDAGTPPDAKAPGRLSAVHRCLLYLASTLLYASGVLWLLVHYTAAGTTQARHPLESWSLQLHGAAAMAFLVVLGSLLPRHVAEAWSARRNRSSGATMLLSAVLLVVTAWSLYYAGSDTTRDWLSMGHWIIGIGSGALFVLHMLLGRRRNRPNGDARARPPAWNGSPPPPPGPSSPEC